MSAPSAQDPLTGTVQASWQRFLESYEPLRPELYRYCRHLTRSPWDAEDMVQEALYRAFVSLALMSEPPTSPRAWLFRVASNAWLNRTRRPSELTPDGEPDAPPVAAPDPRATREAAGTVLAQLSPQERAAVVLKDAFDFSLEEIADTLATTPGAVKAALHRGRGKLVHADPVAPEPVPPAALDAFCEAFNARDLERLTALLLDGATLEYPGFRIEAGAEAVRSGTLRGTLFGCVTGEYELTAPPRAELRAHRGETLMLWWVGEEVHSVVRAELAGERIARLTTYYHAPEVLSEVCRELAVPYRAHGYRPARGAS